MKLLKKNMQELTVGESLLYIILVMISSMAFVPIYFGAIALMEEDNRDAVKRWFKDRWLSMKALWILVFG